MANGTWGPRSKAISWALTNWSIVFSGLFVQSGLNALASIIIARSVAPLEYGLYLASFALASFAVIIPGFGVDAWLLTQAKHGADDALALWLSSIRAVGASLALWLVAMLLLSTALPPATYPKNILAPTLVGVGLDRLNMTSYAALRSQGRHSPVTILQAIGAGLLLAAAIMLPLEESGVALFAVARMLLSLSVALVVLGMLAREYSRGSATLLPIRAILRAARPYFWSNLSSSTYVKADLTIISLILGAAGTSVYGPAINLLQAAFLPSLAVFFLSTPALSKTFDGRWKSISLSGRSGMIAQGLIGLAIMLLLFLFSNGMITAIFGADYEDSAVVLRYLSPVALFRSLNMGAAAIIMATGFQSWRTRVQVVVALFNVIGNLLVVGIYGLMGVSLIYILSEAALFTGQLYLLRRVRVRTSREPA